jgi:3',5'-cyclic-AMP phosphodiesterase
VADYRCVFLDIVSNGTGGPDFALGHEQLRWLGAELSAAAAGELASVVYMHAYPADLKADSEAVRQLFAQHRVAFVDMGHTHYNELANDGSTIFATTRSTGQIEEGPVGFSLASLHHGVVSWRFKPLQTPWPFVMITSPADRRLITDMEQPNQVVAGVFPVSARVLGSSAVSSCRCRIDKGNWVSMSFASHSGEWQGICEAPTRPFTLSVEATDATGGSDVDTIDVAVPGYRPPDRRPDRSDANTVGAWPERHLLATRLGPNRNGRKW